MLGSYLHLTGDRPRSAIVSQSELGASRTPPYASIPNDEIGCVTNMSRP